MPPNCYLDATISQHGINPPPYGHRFWFSPSLASLWSFQSLSSGRTGKVATNARRKLPFTIASSLSVSSSSALSCGRLVQPSSIARSKMETAKICGAGLAKTISDGSSSKTMSTTLLSAECRIGVLCAALSRSLLRSSPSPSTLSSSTASIRRTGSGRAWTSVTELVRISTSRSLSQSAPNTPGFAPTPRTPGFPSMKQHDDYDVAENGQSTATQHQYVNPSPISPATNQPFKLQPPPIRVHHATPKPAQDGFEEVPTQTAAPMSPPPQDRQNEHVAAAPGEQTYDAVPIPGAYATLSSPGYPPQNFGQQPGQAY